MRATAAAILCLVLSQTGANASAPASPPPSPPWSCGAAAAEKRPFSCETAVGPI